MQRIQTDHGTVVVEHGAASLWRASDYLPGYAVLVWPDEEPQLFSILRRATFTREDGGSVAGPYLYLAGPTAHS